MKYKNLKKIIVILSVILITFGINANDSKNLFASERSIWSGTGTQSEPYIIENKEQLKQLANQINNDDTNAQYVGKYFKLTANIDLNNEFWTPIGAGITNTNKSNSFAGLFNGDGHTIKGLNVNGTYEIAGLFGFVSNGGSVKNLIVEGSVTSNLIQTKDHGAFGGIIGILSQGTIENCFANVTVTGSTDDTNAAYIGGLVGETYFSSKIINSGSSGNVTCTASMFGYVGGLAGYTPGNIEITNCYATGDVSSPTYSAGGLIGATYHYQNIVPVIKNSYATGKITGNAPKKGGIVGNLSNGNIQNTVFWNKDNITVGVGSIGSGQTNDSIGLTTSEMISEDTLTNGKMKTLGNKFSKRASDSESNYYPELVVFANNPESTYLSKQSTAIEKPSPDITFPTELTATFGQTLGDISLSNGVGNGTFSWELENNTLVGDAGNNQFTIIFTPTDSSYKVLKQTVSISVLKASQKAPNELTLLNKNETTITLNTITGAEYSVNGTKWQDSPIFNNLSPNTEYTFYARIKETQNYFVSPAIRSAVIKTLLAKQCSIVDNNTGITIEYKDSSSFDADISLTATSKSIEEMKQYQNNINKVAKGFSIIGLYDIKLLKKDIEIQPNKEVKISFSMTDKMKAMTDLQVIYINDNGDVIIIPSQIIDNKLVFMTNHFSYYGIIGREKQASIIQPESTNKPSDENISKPTSPQTGDISNIVFYMGLITLFGSIIILNQKSNPR